MGRTSVHNTPISYISHKAPEMARPATEGVQADTLSEHQQQMNQCEKQTEVSHEWSCLIYLFIFPSSFLSLSNSLTSHTHTLILTNHHIHTHAQSYSAVIREPSALSSTPWQLIRKINTAHTLQTFDPATKV